MNCLKCQKCWYRNVQEVNDTLKAIASIQFMLFQYSFFQFGIVNLFVNIDKEMDESSNEFSWMMKFYECHSQYSRMWLTIDVDFNLVYNKSYKIQWTMFSNQLSCMKEIIEWPHHILILRLWSFPFVRVTKFDETFFHSEFTHWKLNLFAKRRKNTAFAMYKLFNVTFEIGENSNECISLSIT